MSQVEDKACECTGTLAPYKREYLVQNGKKQNGRVQTEQNREFFIRRPHKKHEKAPKQTLMALLMKYPG